MREGRKEGGRDGGRDGEVSGAGTYAETCSALKRVGVLSCIGVKLRVEHIY